jgi:hypothetical protein
LCAFGSKIGQVHAQCFARDRLRWISGKEMHACSKRVARYDEFFVRANRNERCVVTQAEAALPCDWREEARDDIVFGNHRLSFPRRRESRGNRTIVLDSLSRFARRE